MIPLEDLFRTPDRVMVRISPGGGFLSWLAPWNRRLNIHVRELASGQERRVTAAEARDVAGYVWASEDRLIYVQDSGGDENYRLYAVGADGTNPLDLTPFEGVKCDLVDDLEDDDDHVLFQMNRRIPEIFDVYRLNVHSGEMVQVAENPGNVQAWHTDHRGSLRAAVTTDGVNSSLMYRETEQDDWRIVATYDFKEYASPRLFAFDDRHLIVSSNVGRDKAGIFEYDPVNGREGRLLFDHPDVDVAHVLFSRHRRRLTGVSYETDRRHYHFFDERRAELQRTIDERLAGYENTVVSAARDESRFVIHSGSDRTQGRYYLLDAESKILTELFEVAPWLSEASMATMTPIRYESRDGRPIQGYLTVPADVEPQRLPLVVNPHGGPWARDSWGFNPEVQFLASRGYGVLQMNFRGSAGFGRDFLEAGFGQWGLAMQDDITDGVQWAIAEGVADPRRVAIYGGSYGGYAALSGLTKTPQFYCCGISYVGVANLFTWIEAIPPYWKQYLEMLHEMVGHPERDAERFRSTSPYFNAERIAAPLLVAQGANDPRVRKQESDQIVGALRERGIEVEYLVREDEGHGFQNEENRFEFYRAMERFLERNMVTGSS